MPSASYSLSQPKNIKFGIKFNCETLRDKYSVNYFGIMLVTYFYIVDKLKKIVGNISRIMFNFYSLIMVILLLN